MSFQCIPYHALHFSAIWVEIQISITERSSIWAIYYLLPLNPVQLNDTIKVEHWTGNDIGLSQSRANFLMTSVCCSLCLFCSGAGQLTDLNEKLVTSPASRLCVFSKLLPIPDQMMCIFVLVRGWAVSSPLYGYKDCSFCPPGEWGEDGPITIMMIRQ